MLERKLATIRELYAAKLEAGGIRPDAGLQMIEATLAEVNKTLLDTTGEDLQAMIVLAQAHLDVDDKVFKNSPQSLTVKELLPGKIKGFNRSTILAKRLADIMRATNLDIPGGTDPIAFEGDAGRRGWLGD